MKTIKRIITWLRGEPLVVGGALVTAGMAAVQKVHPRTAFEWVATLLPVVLGVAGRYFTVPWSKLRPFVDQAAELTAQIAPKTSQWDRLIQSAVDAAAEQVKATGGFPIPIAPEPSAPAVDPAPTDPSSTPETATPVPQES